MSAKCLPSTLLEPGGREVIAEWQTVGDKCTCAQPFNRLISKKIDEGDLDQRDDTTPAIQYFEEFVCEGSGDCSKGWSTDSVCWNFH